MRIDPTGGPQWHDVADRIAEQVLFVQALALALLPLALDAFALGIVARARLRFGTRVSTERVEGFERGGTAGAA
ncbi:MAG: hypothetical protein ROZ64_18340 [Burkholderiaceae bacterium]|nr:hypothetical protein [Burkholderiaceae bacterium]